MNIYDFDNTIYSGDSTVHFVLYNIKVQPSLFFRHFPRVAGMFLLYKMHFKTLTETKQSLYRFFRDVPDMEKRVSDFWACHLQNLKKWYPGIHREDDVIFSASPDFLVRPACESAGIRHIIASRVDIRTGVYDGTNCSGEEKIRRFRKEFPDAEVMNAFSDSRSDDPMCSMARQAFMVRGDEFLPWPEE